MRRLIAILLLALVSLQSSWAVAAAYCGHETGRDAAHFGHHADADAHALADAGAPDNGGLHHDDADGAGAPAGGHCHDCHACPIGVILPPARIGVHLSSSRIAAPPAPRLPAPPTQPLDRPDWQALA